jgi:hypothetical protein
MHDKLFKQPAVVARYRAGPHAESRERFLKQARADGYMEGHGAVAGYVR